MGSDSETRLAEQDKLRGAENYHQWADEIDNILRSKGLKGFIDLNKTCPEKLEAPETDTVADATRRAACEVEIEKWEANDAKTLVAIQQNLTKQPKDLVRSVKTASTMWAKLKKHYEGKGQSLKSQYLSEIQELDYSSNKFEDITAFIVAFQNLYTQIGQVGMELPHDFYTIMFIKAMSGAFPVWADRWRCNSRTMGDGLTLDMLYEDITDEACDRQPTTTDTNVAMYANDPRGNQDQKKKKKKKNAQSDTGGNSRNNDTKFTSKCNHCQKVGHKAVDCWIKFPDKKPKKKEAATAVLASSGLAMYSRSALNAFKSSWLVDTGAGFHLCHNRQLFQTYTANSTLLFFDTANGVTQAIGYRSITIDVEHLDRTAFPLTLKEVYHLPSLPVNILSGTAIEDYRFYLCCNTHTICKKSTKEELIAINVVDHKFLLRQKNVLICPAVLINT
jgi:hypothetical protein